MKKTLGALVLVAALAGCGDAGDDAPETEGSSPPKWDTGESTEARAATADDFTLDVRVLSKKCTGSGGCAIRLEVVPSVTDVALLEDRTTEVTYELTGIEDEPLVGTITFTGDEHDVEQQAVGTSSADDDVTATVTDVQAY